jgi:hypothetical protein
MDVVQAGAVKIVLNALERSDDDEYLLECATWGLACLTKYGKYSYNYLLLVLRLIQIDYF